MLGQSAKCIFIRCIFFDYSSLGMDSSKLKQYLNQTYQDWSAGRTSIYLATVKENLSPVRSGDNSRFRREVSDLLVDIGDGGTWKGYTNGALKARDKYW